MSEIAAGSQPAPMDWRVPPADHFVEFYSSDERLAESVAAFTACGLKQGEAAIIIATPQHRLQMHDRLLREGIDVMREIGAGNLVVLDAAETLSFFMRGDVPNARHFGAVIGGALSRLAGSGRRIRAFGEMVAVLWGAGNESGAIRLEELWNSLAAQYSFSLFCAYPAGDFIAGDGAQVQHICRCHSRVIGSLPMNAA